MRSAPLAVLAALAVAGCVALVDVEPAGPAVPVVLRETYDGAIVSAHAGVLRVSPDQLGEVEREFFVHEGTTRLDLRLDADGELALHLVPPGCAWGDGCEVVVETADGVAEHAVDAPAVGGWHAVLFRRDAGAGEVAYALEVEKTLAWRAAEEVERYAGEVVAAHLAAVRISPDQLGDVYREFWVHEGTRHLRVDFEADRDAHVVLGQSDRGRDRESEEGRDTTDGRVAFEHEDPRSGGWYLIVFHASNGPGIATVAYDATVTKAS